MWHTRVTATCMFLNRGTPSHLLWITAHFLLDDAYSLLKCSRLLILFLTCQFHCCASESSLPSAAGCEICSSFFAQPLGDVQYQQKTLSPVRKMYLWVKPCGVAWCGSLKTCERFNIKRRQIRWSVWKVLLFFSNVKSDNSSVSMHKGKRQLGPRMWMCQHVGNNVLWAFRILTRQRGITVLRHMGCALRLLDTMREILHETGKHK